MSIDIDHLYSPDEDCNVASTDHCFIARAAEVEVKMAWEVLNLMARYRISQKILYSMYALALIPVSLVHL